MGRYSRSYPGSSTPLSPVDDDDTTTARRRHLRISLSITVVGLPAHRRPLPTLFSTAVPFLRIFKPRTPSTGVDLHRVDELDQARSPSEMPIVEDLPGLPRLHPLASSTNASLGADGCRHYYGWMRLGCISAKTGRKLHCFGHGHQSSRGIASLGGQCNVGAGGGSSGGGGRGGGGSG